MNTVADQISSILANLLATGIALFAAWALAQFSGAQAAIRQKTGLDTEAILRDALHRALESGSQLAASRGQIGNDAVATVIDHVNQSVPDALTALGASQSVLTNLAIAKLQMVAAGG